MGRTSRLHLLAFLASLNRIVVSLDLQPRGDLHFPLTARGTNKDGSLPIYKDAKASIEDRVNDLLPRMTVEEKVSQMYVIWSNIPFTSSNQHKRQHTRRYEWMDGLH